MPKLFGGLLIDNLVRQDEFFELQCALNQAGITAGVQLLVPHPSLTHGVSKETLPGLLARLPSSMQTFIHVGAENRGTDFGCLNDEKGIFNQSGHHCWPCWNRQTLAWALQVGRACPRKWRELPLAVIHVGYGQSDQDQEAYGRIVEVLEGYNDLEIVLENVPPLDPKYGTTWGFGGTPSDMSRILRQPGALWRALIDFTHLVVAVNEAQATGDPRLTSCLDLEQALENFLALPHAKICHFAGIPPASMLSDSHDYLLTPPPTALADALRRMEVICLECRFNAESAEMVSRFRDLYGI